MCKHTIDNKISNESQKQTVEYVQNLMCNIKKKELGQCVTESCCDWFNMISYMVV